jgi:ketopantoate reductase
MAASSVQPSPRRPQQALSSAALYESTLELIKRTERHYSSMSRDVRLGRSTEINYYNGYIADQARLRGLTAPTNELLRSLVRARVEIGLPSETSFR